MRSLWDELRPLIRYLALFSFCINLLFLVPAIFTLQVFDRVIPSNSMETLLVLLAGTGIALGILLLLDFVRNRLQNVLGTIVDERLSPPVVNAIVARAARAPHSARAEGVRDVAAVRNVFSANGLVALFDAPWVVVYVVVIWFCHPVLGIGAALSAVAMLILAWLNARAIGGVSERLQKQGRRAAQYVESSMRNAEVLQALGMTAASAETLARRCRMRSPPLQTSAGRSARRLHGRHPLRASGDPDRHDGAGRLPRAHAAGLPRRHDRHHHPAWSRRAAGRATGGELAAADRRVCRVPAPARIAVQGLRRQPAAA